MVHILRRKEVGSPDKVGIFDRHFTLQRQQIGTKTWYREAQGPSTHVPEKKEVAGLWL
jgi:hypothetical protein